MAIISKIEVSIVMPVFNRKDELKAMIDSILNNTFQNWELLAIDDGSDKDTLDLLDKYASEDKRINVIRRNKLPKGAQTCRNIGLENARGEFVFFADSDDVLAPYCIEQRVEALKKKPDLDFMVFPSSYIQDGKVYEEGNADHLFGYSFGGDDLDHFLQRILPFIVWNNLYRTSSLKDKNLLWDTQLISLQDSDFNIQAILNGLKYEYAELPQDYQYRLPQKKNNITNSIFDDRNSQNIVYLINKLFKTVTEAHGHDYDRSMYIGTEYFLLQKLSKCFNWDFANLIATVLSSNNQRYGRKLKSRLKILNALRHVLPYKIALRLIFIDYYMPRKRQLESRKKIIIKQRTHS